MSGISQYNFEHWLENVPDPNLKVEALKMQNDERGLEDSFSQNLQFGVEEIRALEGVGINKINIYTVCQISQAIAKYFSNKLSNPTPSAIITFDARPNSQKFANLCASVLRMAGYNCTITTTAKPTPYLAFLVQELKCDVGISITGGHNEVEYNGFKIFNSNGIQIDFRERYYISQISEQLDPFEVYNSLNLSDNSINKLDDTLVDKFIDCNFEQRVGNSQDKLAVVYSDFNGANKDMMSKIFAKLGTQAHFVNSPKSSHSSTPNVLAHDNSGEFGTALLKAVQVNADLIINPSIDCCRIDVMVKDGENYVYLGGNDLALLFSYYILEKLRKDNKLPDTPLILRSNVSTPIIDEVVKAYGGEVLEFAPGFQNVYPKMQSLQKISNSVLFSFEENGNFMQGAPVPNAIFSSILICDVFEFLKEKNTTIIECLKSIHNMYGECTYLKLKFKYPGVGGAKMRKYLMNAIAQCPLAQIGGEKIWGLSNHNYKQELRSNTIEYIFKNGDRIFIRPSSTEEAVFCYMYFHNASQDKIMQATQEIYDLLVEPSP